MSAPTISVIVSTYEWPEALDVVLLALSEQSDQAFEVVVADDGSGPRTADVIDHRRRSFDGGLEHVWQADSGWRKARILDLAAARAHGDYLFFLDGDSVPRRRFVESVRRAAIPGWFLASKRLFMSPGLSRRVIEGHVPVWRWSASRWLVRTPRELFTSQRQTARPGVLIPVRDRRRPWRQRQPEFSPPFDAYGYCGVFRNDFERVNGFDLRYVGWGSEDFDLAIRLRRFGLRCGWPGPHATMLHLWHPPKKGTMRTNAPLRRATQRSSRVEAVEGSRELSAELDETTR